MTCPHCAMDLPENAAFCHACGKPTTIQAVTVPKKAIGKRFWIIIILLVSAAALCALGLILRRILLPFSENTSAIAKASSSVVMLRCYDHESEEAAIGSGFIAFNDRTVITNYHVMEDAYTCEVITNQNATLSVESILAYSKSKDLAIVQLSESSGLQPLVFGRSDSVKIGASVTAIGSPLGIMNTVSTGILSGNIEENSMDVLQFTAPISSGSSGGALFDDHGKVIGVTYASYVNGQNLNLAIPINEVTDLHAKSGAAADVSEIYLDTHPYVQYLDDYEYTVEITITDLKNYPERYEGKTVKLRTFVSSVVQGELRYVSDFAYVSGSIDADQDSTHSADFDEYPYLYAISSDTCKYEATDLEPGDPVVLIGKFRYYRPGDVLFTIKDTPYYTWDTDGRFLCELIYKDE